jgi:ribosome-binding factor A
MAANRPDRVNSLLKEVISDVIRKKVKNPHLSTMASVTRVSVSKDIRHAKVYISVIGDEKQQKENIDALQSAAGFIAVQASKEVKMRFFPELRFILDDSAEKHQRIDAILKKLHDDNKEQGRDPAAE